MAFQQQDHVAHIRVHAAMLQQPATATNPQAFMMLQSHVQEHIAMHSRDLVQEMFQELGAQAQAQGEPIPEVDPDALEAAVAQQVADTTEELAPLCSHHHNSLIHLLLFVSRSCRTIHKRFSVKL